VEGRAVSDFQAIGGVSASLRNLLRDRMELPPGLLVPTVPVTVSPPPQAPEDPDAVEAARVNLFLYRITRNTALSNQEIPGQGHANAYGRPPLSLDLHFLLTAYGTEEGEGGLGDETVAHFLLGSAMRVLHDIPVITEALLDRNGVPILHPALHGEGERVRITLDPLELEDLTKVWTATTFPYRLSAAYSVSVVQIESLGSRRQAQLVGEPLAVDPAAAGPQVLVLPAVAPTLRELRVRRGGGESRIAYARILDELVLLGQGLAGGPTRVWIGGREVSDQVLDQQSDRLVVRIPDHPELEPGPQTVSVSVGGSAFRSNQAVFLLVPRLDLPIARDMVAVPRRFTLQGSRLWSESLRGEILVGEERVPWENLLGVPQQDLLVVPLPDTLPAWPVRVLRSGPLVGPINVPDLALTVAVDGGAPEALNLDSGPTDLTSAGAVLERALRRLAAPALAGARVAAAADHLWVVPGELRHGLEFAGPAAGPLALGAPPAAEVNAWLSGRLEPWPGVRNAAPRLAVTLDAQNGEVELGAPPTSPADAAVRLQAGFGGGGLPAIFAQVRVVLLGQQLLLATDAAAMTITGVPGVDETTVSDLRLQAPYAVRVRVNGAEDIDQRREVLP
jgi:hypothetical protein